MFRIIRGQDFQRLGAIRADGEAVDATGWLVRMFLREPCGDFSVELTVTWLDQANGSFEAVNPASTADYPLGRLILDTRLTAPGGTLMKATPEPVQVENL